MIAFAYKTKKELKSHIGKELDYIETSFFGPEYRADGWLTGVVSKQPDKVRNSFARVLMQDGKIRKVE